MGIFDPGKMARVPKIRQALFCCIVQQHPKTRSSDYQCIPPPRHVLTVPPSDESAWAADLCPLTTFSIS